MSLWVTIAYTIGARKQFWNNKASIGLTATNPFNKYIKQETTIETSNYISTAIWCVPFRSFGINFNYKFGKLEFRKKDEQNNTDSNTMPTFNN